MQSQTIKVTKEELGLIMESLEFVIGDHGWSLGTEKPYEKLIAKLEKQKEKSDAKE